DAGNVGMVHEGQRLPLRLEAGNDLARVHPRLNDLEGHPAPYWLPLLGHKDGPHAALADLFQQLVRAYDRTGDFPAVRSVRLGEQVAGRRFQEVFGLRAGRQQALDLPAQLRIVPAGVVEVSLALARRRDLPGIPKNLVYPIRWHDARPVCQSLSPITVRKNGAARLTRKEKISGRPKQGPGPSFG